MDVISRILRDVEKDGIHHKTRWGRFPQRKEHWENAPSGR